MGWLAIAGKVIGFLVGLFTKAPDPTADAEKTGEQLGAAKGEAANAEEGLREVDTAQQARQRVDGDLAAHPDRVRGVDADASPRGADGIS